MGDPQPRDRETIGAGGSEPEATVADLGPNGPPDTPGTTLAGEVDPGQATGGVTLAHETSATATGVGDADARRPSRLRTDPPPRADHRRLPDRGRARPRRHGGRLPGAAGPPEPPLRPEGDPGRRPRRPRRRRPLPGRGRGRRQAPAPQHRPDPPHRRGRRPALPRAGVRRRAAAWTGGSTAPPGRRGGRRRWSRRWPAASPRRTGWGSSTAT